MKRLYGFFVLLVFIYTVTPAMAEWKTANQRQVQTTEETEIMFSDWENMLETVNNQNDLILWGLGQVEKYTAWPTWENLCAARASCVVVAQTLESLSWPEQTLSDAQLLRLSSSGIPVEIYIIDFQAMDFTKCADTFQSLHLMLETSWYDSTCVDQLRNQCKAWKKYVQSSNTFLMVETNYLYLYLFPSPEVANEKANRWYDSDTYFWANNTNELELHEPLFKDQYDAAKKQIANLPDLNPLTDWTDSQMDPALFSISNLPQLLPTPSWLTMESAHVRYYTESESGVITYPQFGESMVGLSEFLSVNDVALAQVEEWMEQIEPYTESILRDGNRWSITTRDYYMSVLWIDQTVRFVFNNQLCTFTDVHYLDALDH